MLVNYQVLNRKGPKNIVNNNNIIPVVGLFCTNPGNIIWQWQ